MKTLIKILISFIFFINCKGRNKYFEPKGIIDKVIDNEGDQKKWVSLSNKESIDGYTRIGDSIFGGEIACDIEALDNIDIKTFKVLPGTNYAKDKNNVYYPLNQYCIDYEDCGVCYYSEILIKTAKPKNFKYMGKEYAKDGENVYFRGKLVNDADGKTFKVINGPDFFFFAVDKNYVFRHNQIFEKADSQTFFYDETDKRNVKGFGGKFIIGDKNKEWEFIPPDTINEIKKD